MAVRKDVHLIRRTDISEEARRVQSGPKAGGVFFAPVTVADELGAYDWFDMRWKPGVVHAQASVLIRRGELYVRDVQRPDDPWVRVMDPRHIPRVIGRMGLDTDIWGIEIERMVYSSLPQLYWIPDSSRRARRMYRRFRAK